MLCSKKFEAEKQDGYNLKWAVVFNDIYGEDWTPQHQRWDPKLNDRYSHIDDYIEKTWEKERMTQKDQDLREKFLAYLSDKMDSVYPNGHLLCGGSSISKCGTLTSDMDLCFAIKVYETTDTKYNLPIDKYDEIINKFIIDRMHLNLRQYKEIKDIDTVNARVPIVTFSLNAKDVDPNEEDQLFEFDINCNCVAGIYNSYLLGGFARYDDRLPKLAIILKKWGKSVGAVAKSRLNSYGLVLLIVHYLQCGVNPPVLPNLIKLLPEDYDGNKDPWDLTTELNWNRLPERENKMSTGMLLCGFFRYYSEFDFLEYGILIRDASIIKKSAHGRFGGGLKSRMFVEEPYDGLTVPKCVESMHYYNDIKKHFKDAMHLMNPAKDIKPTLQPLLERNLQSAYLV